MGARTRFPLGVLELHCGLGNRRSLKQVQPFRQGRAYRRSSLASDLLTDPLQASGG